MELKPGTKKDSNFGLTQIINGFILYIALSVILISCFAENDGFQDDTIIDPSKEVANDVTIIYSDSAEVQFQIKSPRLEKYDDNGILVEEFPKGLLVEFFDEEKNVNSWVRAKYALRRSAEGTMLLKDSVVLSNQKNDVLETNSILWDDVNKSLSTPKFVRIIQGGAAKDTLYGMGFNAKTDFSKFEIQRFYGKRQSQDLSKEFGIDN